MFHANNKSGVGSVYTPAVFGLRGLSSEKTDLLRAFTRTVLAGTMASDDFIVRSARVHCVDSFTPDRYQSRMYR